MSEYTEQRHFSRIPFDAEVQITDPLNDSKHSARLLDISLKGALTTQPDALVAEVNKTCLLELSLTDSNNDIRLEMEALVVHMEDGRIGFQYQHMDLDTAAHLHRLVELNLADEKLMERELAELARFND
jgi:c-di-GMP-binding flagellar brake protein YcgR